MLFPSYFPCQVFSQGAGWVVFFPPYSTGRVYYLYRSLKTVHRRLGLCWEGERWLLAGVKKLLWSNVLFSYEFFYMFDWSNLCSAILLLHSRSLSLWSLYKYRRGRQFWKRRLTWMRYWTSHQNIKQRTVPVCEASIFPLRQKTGQFETDCPWDAYCITGYPTTLCPKIPSAGL